MSLAAEVEALERVWALREGAVAVAEAFDRIKGLIDDDREGGVSTHDAVRAAMEALWLRARSEACWNGPLAREVEKFADELEEFGLLNTAPCLRALPSLALHEPEDT